MTDDNLIDGVCERIKFDRDKLEGDGLPRIEVDSFNLSEFWPQFESAVQALSNQTTKVSFMCHTKPFPPKSEVSSSALDILQYYNIMRDLYLVLPEEVGSVVFKATTTAVLDIAKALHNVIHSFSELTEKASEERMKLIGTFWDACNSVQSLPKNNLLATLNLFEEESALASDALEELNTVVKNGNSTTMNHCSQISTKPRETDKETKNSNPTNININNKVSLNAAGMSSRSDLITDHQTSSERETQDRSKGDVVGANDHIIVKMWVTEQRAINRPADLATLEEDLTAVQRILMKLAYNIHDPIFFGLTMTEKLHKQEKLQLKLSVLIYIKNIIVRSPQILESVKASVENDDEEIIRRTEVPELSSQIQNLAQSGLKNKSNSVVTSWPQLNTNLVVSDKPLQICCQQPCSSGHIPNGTSSLRLSQQSGAPNSVGVKSMPLNHQGGSSTSVPIGTKLVPFSQEGNSSVHFPVGSYLRSKKTDNSAHNPLPTSQQAGSSELNPVWPPLNQQGGSSSVSIPVGTSKKTDSSVPNPVEISSVPLSQQAAGSVPTSVGTSYQQTDCYASNPVEMSQQAESSVPTSVGTSYQQTDCYASNPVEMSQKAESSVPTSVGTSCPHNQQTDSSASNPVEMSQQAESSVPTSVGTSSPHNKQTDSSASNPVEINSVPSSQQPGSSVLNPVLTTWPLFSQQSGSSGPIPVGESLLHLTQQSGTCTPNPFGMMTMPMSHQANSYALNPFEMAPFSQQAGSSVFNPGFPRFNQQTGGFAPIPAGPSWVPLNQQANTNAFNPFGPPKWPILNQMDGNSVEADWPMLDVKADHSKYVEMPKRTETQLRKWIRITTINKNPVSMEFLESEIDRVSKWEKLSKGNLKFKLIKERKNLLCVKKGFEACQAKGVSVLLFTTHVQPPELSQDPYFALRTYRNRNAKN